MSQIKNGKIQGHAMTGQERSNSKVKMYRDHEKFLAAWKKAGCPQNFKWSNGRRIWDAPAMQERQAYLEASSETRKILDSLAAVRWEKKQLFLKEYFGE